MKLCKCGCKTEVTNNKNDYLLGHTWKGKKRTFTIEVKRDISRKRTDSSRSPKATVSPTIKDLYWAAGFLEGEGWFGGSNTSEMVGATQIQLEPLEKLQNIFGGTIKPRKARGKSKPYFAWTIYGGRARGVMMTLWKMFSTKRKMQIKLSLERNWLK